MSPIESIATCFSKYSTFTGVASRSEYWWFLLFCSLAYYALSALFLPLGLLWGIAALIPVLASGARRLHETKSSGWWQLLVLVPWVGWIALTMLLVQGSNERPQVSSSEYAPTTYPVQNALVGTFLYCIAISMLMFFLYMALVLTGGDGATYATFGRPVNFILSGALVYAIVSAIVLLISSLYGRFTRGLILGFFLALACTVAVSFLPEPLIPVLETGGRMARA